MADLKRGLPRPHIKKHLYLRDREVLIAEVSARFETTQPDHPAVNRLFAGISALPSNTITATKSGSRKPAQLASPIKSPGYHAIYQCPQQQLKISSSPAQKISLPHFNCPLAIPSCLHPIPSPEKLYSNSATSFPTKSTRMITL